MIRSKILDMDDLKQPGFAKMDSLFNAHFGSDWPEVPLRRWEYCAAALFSEVVDKPGKALDAGCGSSVFPAFLKAIECEVHALDPGVGNHEDGGVHYRKGSMTQITEFHCYFDYVFAISSIEHVNAGRFTIPGTKFDTGDTLAMLELCRVLKPGGVLVLTTDFAEHYHGPPGLWPSGSHRVYDLESLHSRLFIPAIGEYRIRFWDEAELQKDDWSDIRQIEPKGYDYTEIILTLRKMK